MIDRGIWGLIWKDEPELSPWSRYLGIDESCGATELLLNVSIGGCGGGKLTGSEKEKGDGGGSGALKNLGWHCTSGG